MRSTTIFMHISERTQLNQLCFWCHILRWKIQIPASSILLSRNVGLNWDWSISWGSDQLCCAKDPTGPSGDRKRTQFQSSRLNPFQSVQTADHLTEGSFSSYFRSSLQQLWVIFLQYYWILILLQNLWGKSESGFHEGAVLQIRSFTNSRFSLSSVKIWQQCQTLGCPTQLNWMMPLYKNTEDKLSVKNLFISCSSKLLQK